MSRLADAGHDAIGTLTDLMHGSDDDAIRPKAAKTLLDSLLATQKQESAPTKDAGNVSANVGSIALTVRNDEQSGPLLAIESVEEIDECAQAYPIYEAGVPPLISHGPHTSATRETWR